ncbi:hypothetical protein [Terrabacter sp. NPDC000476]|uniref:hypothetical protein n=1 Tax=Terrabacter sp. NPDC000476 TaxID=3154258 RepID=UPI003317CF7F
MFGLSITTATKLSEDRSSATAQAARAADVLRFVGDEAVNVTSTEYERQGNRMTINRFEALLVQKYREHLGVDTRRIRVPAGVTDMAIGPDDAIEVVEAKSSTSRLSIRTAIGQLFDYCSYIPSARNLTVLLPEQPAPTLQELCLKLGINVVYPSRDASFIRHDATAEARGSISALLHSDRPYTGGA